MLYVSPIEDRHALIETGPVIGDLDPRLLTSADLHDVADCWEKEDLPTSTEEQQAHEVNATDALARLDHWLDHAPGGSAPSRLLDVGCGWGFFLNAAKRQGWKAIGLEPLPGHAIYARANFGVDVVTDVLHPDLFAPASFDTVTAFQVFEHLPHPSADLGCIFRCLKPSGVVLIEVPDGGDWTVSALRSHHRHFAPDHLNFFSAHTLRLLLEQHGFQVLEHYLPHRHMTLHHLVHDWGGCYLPGAIQHPLESITAQLHLLNRIVSVSAGDIVAMIGRKPK